MSRRTESDWISYTDLMASAVVIVLIMFVISAAATRIEKDAVERAGTNEIVGALQDLTVKIRQQHLEKMVQVDPGERTMILLDATFESASACMAPQAIQVLGQCSERIRPLLENHPEIEMFIEGHTDNKPLTRALNRCGAFDDNYTLSTVRARNARNVFVQAWPEALQERVSLAGFGPSHPIAGLGLDDSRQRRVAIRFMARTSVSK